MLKFTDKVEAPDGGAAVYVFSDLEKGHTVYLTCTGMLTVVEEDKAKKKNARIAGFTIDDDECGNCGGC